ncbi:MAG: hypothetical protein ONB12_12915 [candidate division KSB1 bacterium]|nr:hypothetical protein [candidate division KSB1 bacterium]
MKLIDTHNHVIPFVDDGAEDWDVSLQMLREAEEDGISEVICTPHVLSNKDLTEEEKFISLFEELKKRALDAGIRVNLYLGSELYIQPHYDFSRRMATLAQNGRYFLVEFPMGQIPTFAEKNFFSLFGNQVTPVIAHPERNGSILGDPQKAYFFVQHGALLQVTAGSLLGNFGSQVAKLAAQLMDANLVQLVATDAHDTSRRRLKLKQAYEFVRANWGPDRAEKLFCVNPSKLIRGEEIELGFFEAVQEQEEPSRSLRQKLRDYFRR